MFRTIAGTIFLVAPSALAQEVQDPATEAEWRYVVPAEGERHRHPPLVAVALGVEPAEDLKPAVEWSGDLQRYGQLRYGDADSTRVAVVLDQRGIDGVDLYVDANRDRTIDASDAVALSDDGRWYVSIAVATTIEGKVEYIPRRVVFQLGRTGAIFSYATMGYLEGGVELEGREIAARRMDGNGDGFFTDSRDQVWLDLDGDGAWAPMRELFLYRPTVKIGTDRFALRSDRLGDGLAIERVEGFGSIHLELPPAAEGAPPRTATALNVLLVGRDGSAVGVRSLGETVEVPIGEYRVGMVTFRLADTQGGQEWSFVFSEPGDRDELTWYTVEKDAEVEIDPVGQLDFQVGVGGDKTSCAPGDRLSGSPKLFTQDGLLINIAFRGRSAPTWSSGTLAADVSLLAPTGQVLDRATSGFA